MVVRTRPRIKTALLSVEVRREPAKMPLSAFTVKPRPNMFSPAKVRCRWAGFAGRVGADMSLGSAAPLLLSGLCREAHFDSEPQHRPRREMKESQDVGARGRCAQGQTERARHDAVVGRGSFTGRNARRQTGPRAPFGRPAPVTAKILAENKKFCLRSFRNHDAPRLHPIRMPTQTAH